MEEQDYLVHYGVLGMKWGVRKNRKPSANRIEKAQKKAQKYNEKSKKQASLSKKYKEAAVKENVKNTEKLSKLRYKKEKYDYKRTWNSTYGFDADADYYFLKSQKINKKIHQTMRKAEHLEYRSTVADMKSTKYKQKADNLISKYGSKKISTKKSK